jgi:hypothetical protein
LFEYNFALSLLFVVVLNNILVYKSAIKIENTFELNEIAIVTIKSARHQIPHIEFLIEFPKTDKELAISEPELALHESVILEETFETGSQFVLEGPFAETELVENTLVVRAICEHEFAIA